MSEAVDIVEWIVTDDDLDALIDGRVYPIVLPADPKLPAMTYQLISEEQDFIQDGPGLANPRYRFKVWTRTYVELEPVINALKARFNGRHDGPFRTSLVDGSVEDRDAKTYRYWRTLDIMAWQPAGSLDAS